MHPSHKNIDCPVIGCTACASVLEGLLEAKRLLTEEASGPDWTEMEWLEWYNMQNDEVRKAIDGEIAKGYPPDEK